MLRPGVKVSYLTQSSPAGIKSVNIVNADTFYLGCSVEINQKKSILLIEKKKVSSPAAPVVASKYTDWIW